MRIQVAYIHPLQVTRITSRVRTNARNLKFSSPKPTLQLKTFSKAASKVFKKICKTQARFLLVNRFLKIQKINQSRRQKVTSLRDRSKKQHRIHSNHLMRQLNRIRLLATLKHSRNSLLTRQTKGKITKMRKDNKNLQIKMSAKKISRKTKRLMHQSSRFQCLYRAKT